MFINVRSIYIERFRIFFFVYLISVIYVVSGREEEKRMRPPLRDIENMFFISWLQHISERSTKNERKNVCMYM